MQAIGELAQRRPPPHSERLSATKISLTPLSLPTHTTRTGVCVRNSWCSGMNGWDWKQSAVVVRQHLGTSPSCLSTHRPALHLMWPALRNASGVDEQHNNIGGAVNIDRPRLLRLHLIQPSSIFYIPPPPPEPIRCESGVPPSLRAPPSHPAGRTGEQVSLWK